MFRIRRVVLLAVLGFVLALAATQAQTPPPSAIPVLVKPFCNITVWGFGATEAEALANAQAELNSKYRVWSSRVASSRCDTIEVPDPQPNDPFHTTSMTICSVELTACGILKVIWVIR